MSEFFKDLWAVSVGKLLAVGAFLVAIYHPETTIVYFLFWGAVIIELIEKGINIAVDYYMPKRREPKPWTLKKEESVIA